MLLVVKEKRLNKRTSIPTRFGDKSSVIGQVIQGFRFDGEEVAPADIPNPSLGNWYKDRDGYFYWGGGLAEELISDIRIPETNYNLRIKNIPNSWRATLGNHVTVAVLDSGFTPHIDLTNNIIDTFNAVDNTANVTPIGNDNPDHGNSVAGLIASDSNLSNGIIGIAPRSKLILVKISKNGFIRPTIVLNGLKYAIEKTNAKIINLSFSIDSSHYAPFKEEFSILFEKAKNKGVIIIAAAGDNSGLLSSESELLLPANEDYCLSVGTIDSNFISNHPIPSFHSHLKFLVPNQSLKSCAGITNYYSEISNSSMAAAIASGTAALLSSHLNNLIDAESVLEKLREHLNEFNTINFTDLSIYKL